MTPESLPSKRVKQEPSSADDERQPPDRKPSPRLHPPAALQQSPVTSEAVCYEAGPASVQITLHFTPSGEANPADFLVSQIPGEFERVRRRTRHLLARVLQASPDGSLCRRLEGEFHDHYPNYNDYTSFLPFLRMVLVQSHETHDFKQLQAGRLSAKAFMESVFNPTGLGPT